MNGNASVRNLTCNFHRDPIGIDPSVIRLGWRMESDLPDQKQTAYRVIVSGSESAVRAGKADIWDSGRVESGVSVDIPYGGRPLRSGERCWWSVCAFDRDGNRTDYGKPAFFEAGLIAESDWTAKWIAGSLAGSEVRKSVPAPYLRKSFDLSGTISSARLYVCGIGYQDLYLNGTRVADEELAPSFTSYDKTLLYNTYDIAPFLRNGKNAVGVILGNGWYNCFTTEVWSFEHAPWRHHPKLILQIEIRYADGRAERIVSDPSWKTSSSPIVFDALRNGEFYDARLEIPAWADADLDDSEWKNAKICRSPGGTLKPASLTPIKTTHSLPSVGMKEAEPGKWVFDIGQNLAGWAELSVSGPAGTEIVLQYSEKILESGDIDVSNINQFVKSGEFQTDKYILKGVGTEIWHPRFVYHGFRYVRVSGLPAAPTLGTITGKFVHTAFETRGRFECSNDLLNKIQTASLWATQSNYHGIPTDCPHREKNGWTGDASLSAEQVLLNFNPMSAYAKWMGDHRDVQRASGQLPGIVPTGGWGYNWGSGPAWDSAMMLIPWYQYVYTGDTSVMSAMYGNMKRYVDFMLSMADTANGGYLVDFGLGDWCPPNSKPDRPKCRVAVTDTAYFYVETLTVSKCAAILGIAEEAAEYAALAAKIRASFRKAFLTEKDVAEPAKNQTGISCILYQGLSDAGEEEYLSGLLIDQIKAFDSHIDCGILGAKYIMNCLTDLGLAEYAYDMAAQDTFPSWGDMIARGATTLWETWNGDSSQNHHMFSDVSAWFYKCLAGIQPDPAAPGFKHMIIAPNPVRDLKWVKSHHDSPYGTVSVDWTAEGGAFRLNLTIPANTTATVVMPALYANSILGAGKQTGTDRCGRPLFELGSGFHSIASARA